jgi:tRNA(Ile)-lysidine synthase
MLEDFQKFIQKEKLFKSNQRILLAVSGGVDSSVMAWLFYKAGFSFGIVHCNFNLRKMESDGDEYFVREMAAKYDAPFYTRHFDTAEFAREKGISIQMAARELRYEFFSTIAEQKGFDYIATAHHLNDATETFFINLLRGTGIGGLHGIAVKQGNIIRPLLFASRRQIENAAKKEKICFREDSSNEEDKYLRNRIRHTLIPVLEKMDDSFSQTMKGNMDRIRQAEEIYRKTIETKAAEVITLKKDLTLFPIEKLKKLDPLHAYLFEFLTPFGFNDDAVSGILLSLDGIPGKFFYSPSHRLLIDRHNLIVSPLPVSTEKNLSFLIKKNETSIHYPVNLKISKFNRTSTFCIPKELEIACLDADKLVFPLEIRKWKKGDVFFPLGASGKKKLSDFFTDHKFSRIEKENCWLLCSDKTIAWIVGHRIAHPFRITARTKNVFQLTLTED